MNGRRTIIGLCMLCALLVSALAAQSASAITGTTTFTCVKGQGTLRGEHCLTTGGASAEYGHVVIPQDKKTDLITSNEKTETETTAASIIRLKITISGVQVEFSATGLSGSGSVENKIAGSGEHYTRNEGTITFTGVKVTKPEGRGCKVFTDVEATKTKGEEGVIHTRALTGTTLEQGDFFKFQAAEGASFANFFMECEAGKQIPAIEGTWECTGSFKATPIGATATFTHEATTAENTLKCRGTKAGLDGKLTLNSRETGGGNYFPASATTVTT